MADTIGDMIDKLTIANIRLWMLEDARREYCTTDKSIPEKELKIILNKISQSNKERNSLIDQINASLRILIDKIKNKDSTFILSIDSLLGSGKNKFYLGEDK